jgi:lipoprotein-releasing system permease protein
MRSEQPASPPAAPAAVASSEPVRAKPTAPLLWLGALTTLVGLGVMVAGLANAGAAELIVADLGLSTVGWGAILEAPLGWLVAAYTGTLHDMLLATLGAGGSGIGDATVLTLGGLVVWCMGWVLLVLGLRKPQATPEALSDAVSAPLNPRIAKYRDFHWGTLAAYGFGILGAGLAVVFTYIFLIGLGATAGQTDESQRVFTPVSAFLVSLGIGCLIAFGGGYAGAANSKRLSTPEATLAMLYFGLPVPLLLSLMHVVPALMLKIGYRLREITYLSSLLGENRPQLGYWLVFILLALIMTLGINTGFVATSSGRTDLRTGFELFVANRHVSVFRPSLLLGAFAVLILGILPPLIVYAFIAAAAYQVERTRIRHLGHKDPQLAARALNELKQREQRPTEMMTALSVGGVGVGVMALIIVLSVMSGFEQDLQQKILGTNSHGVVLKYSDAMPEYQDVMKKVATVKGVAGATPFILNEVMIAADANISGSMIKGIDPQTVGSVTDLPKYLLPPARLEWLENPKLIEKRHVSVFSTKKGEEGSDVERDPNIEQPKEEDDDVVLPGIILGRELAASLKVVVGDRLNVVSPLGGELGPQGPMPKSRPFRVAGIFYSGMFEYDSKFVYIHLREAESFFGIKGATGIELKVEDIDDARRVMRAIYDKLEGYPYRTKDWGEMNRNLFAALRLEKLVMAIILSVIVIVAAGLIVATVIMLVLEKRKEIAVLKALGVSDGGIVKIFLAEGLQIGVAGGILGLISGLAWCLFIEKVGIKLDPQVYYIPALPVKIEPLQTALAVVIAILVTFLASIYPALKASQVEPVEGLKAE